MGELIGARWSDGGLATTLQAEHGLPPYTALDRWLVDRPEAIAAVHRAFRAAGAELLLAGTFTTFPDPDLAERALSLTRSAAGGAAVYASLGPGDDRARAAFVERFDDQVDGYVLETFVDPLEAARAVECVRRRTRHPVIASLVPGPRARLGPLVDAGADVVGFNCGAAPSDVWDAVTRLDPVPTVPLWAKPAGGPGAVQVLAALAARCAWVGGCCGVSPAELARAREVAGG
ncbi:MAG: homocysteine S-methyltransferase family protein [Myxococcota bacterium]